MTKPPARVDGASSRPLEPIQRQTFADPDRMRVQDEAIASAQTHTEEHIAAYRADPRSFGGRYIAADLFKETFVDTFASSKEARNAYNTPVHNAAAVLSSEQFRRVLEQPAELARNTVVFLTGVPGAGKTSSVLSAGELAPHIRAVFEGQLVKPETTIPKIQQVLDAGLRPEIIAVHRSPESALRNTLQRFDEEGRGASIGTMATIQGGTPDGLRAVQQHFGDAVELTVIDYRDLDRPGKVRGWDNGIQVLRSEGNRDDIAARLTNELDRLNAGGGLTEAAYRQAAGKAPLRLDPRLGRPDADRREADASGRGLPQDDRAKAFLNLPPGEAVKAYPELAPVFANIEAMRRRLETIGLSEKQQAAVVEKERQVQANRIAKGELSGAETKRPSGRER